MTEMAVTAPPALLMGYIVTEAGNRRPSLRRHQPSYWDTAWPSNTRAESAGSVMFSFELEFAGVFRLRNIPQEALNMMVLIECPRILFPFAREIVATTVRNGGFPPLLLDPVDFAALYRQKMAQMQPGQVSAS